MSYFLYFDWSFSRISREKKIYLYSLKFFHVDELSFFIPVMDCRLSEWSTWSSCDSNCGRGVARRSRHVIHPAANGGAECEALDQTRSCTGEGDCSSRKNREIVSAFSGKYIVSFMKVLKNCKKMRENPRFPESAMLLPGKYGQKRVKNYDVRHNLKSYKKPDTRDQ
jgi:hypothetical protein